MAKSGSDGQLVTPLLKTLLNSLIQQLMDQKQAVALRDLIGIERSQQNLQTLWAQLQKVNPEEMARFPMECLTIRQLVSDTYHLLSSEYQRVSITLNLLNQSTYNAKGEQGNISIQSQECLA